MIPIQLWAEVMDLFEAYREPIVAVARGLGTFLVVWVAGWWLAVPAVGRVVEARNPKNRTVANAVRRYLRAVVLLVAVVAGVVAAGYGYLLVGSAIVVAALTLAVGVAGREAIGNLVSGVFLVADPDFNVDDWISWPGGQGVVESISFRVTRVRTQNNEVVVVPNTVLTTGQVTRPYGRDDFRITVEFGVDYDEDVPAAMDELREVARGIDGVKAEPAPVVRLLELDPDAARLRVEFWVPEPDRVDVLRIRSTYLERVVARFDELGVAINPPSKRELSGAVAVEDRGQE